MKDNLKIFKKVDFPSLGQESFLKVMSKLAGEGSSLQVISLEGFPASCVDLGALQDDIKCYWEENDDLRQEELAELVKEELPSVVQRVKKVEVEWEERTPHLNVLLRSKDDYGSYEYKFYVHLV